MKHDYRFKRQANKLIVLSCLVLLSGKTGSSSHEKEFFTGSTTWFEETENSRGFEKDEINILSWNIYMLPYLHYLHSSVHRAGIIGDLLSESHHDIIVFQEAFHTPSREVIRKKLAARFPYFYGPFNDPGVSVFTSSGVCVASRKPLRVLKSIRFDRLDSFDALAWKGAVLMEGRLRDKPFHLIATHLQSNDYPLTRARQMDQIYIEMMMPLNHKDISRIICGDLNVDSDNTTEYESMLRKLHADDNLSQLNGKVSYDEINNLLARNPSPHARTLDYILIGNSPDPASVKRKVSVIEGFLSGRKIELSDHYAIEAVIGYRALQHPYKDITSGYQKKDPDKFIDNKQQPWF